MQQYPGAKQTASVPDHAQHRVGGCHHDLGCRNAGLRHWRTTAAGALLPLLSAAPMSWSGVAAHSVAAGMEQDARGMTYLLAVAIGTLSWLAAVVIVAAILLGVMLLLDALAQRYWPQDVRPSWDRIPTAAAASPATALAGQQNGLTVAGRE